MSWRRQDGPAASGQRGNFHAEGRAFSWKRCSRCLPLIAGLQRGKCIANLLCGAIMPSREVIRPYDCNKWHARRAKQSQLVGAQVDVGKSLAANRGSKSKLSPRMDGEQKKS